MIELKLFNLNDIAVLLCAVMSLVLTFLLIAQSRRLKNLLLAVFFFQWVLHAVDTLIYWNANINAAVSSVSANLFFLFGFSLLLQGPLLYGFTRAAIYRDFALKPRDLLHLLPALLYPFYMYVIYYRLDENAKLAYAHDWSLVIANPWFEALIWAQRLSVFGYSLLCVSKLYQYIHYLKTHSISVSKVDLQWLKLLLPGFLCVSAWLMLALVESRLLNLGMASFMGIAESYIRLILIGALVVYLLLNSQGLADIQPEHAIATPATPRDQCEPLLESLLTMMDTEKPFLEPHITLDRLAARLDVSPKLLSHTINRKLNKNFFEMISCYRIAEAKSQLADMQLQRYSISEIMKNCGFNSKSVFNQAFKKRIGVTPSHYRQQHLG